jgi:tetratricopeptide (TPR) repeat protein
MCVGDKCFAKTMLGDYSGALTCADRAVDAEPTMSFCWQERGVLKELMGKYEEALEDLNRASKLAEPVDDYEILKHRAYVNFKLGHEDEARKDAEKALLAPGHYLITDPRYNLEDLGSLSVPQFLGYDLK